MTQSNIHPSAIIEPGAEIGDNVTIEAYAVIKRNVKLEEGVVVRSHAYIDGYTTIGAGTEIWPSASIGTKTQDLKFRGEKTYVIIGKNCQIREFVTINSSCAVSSSEDERPVVRVGDNCLIMAYCHIAHNCEIGNRVIMANNAMLAGHVIVEDHAIIGGMTPVHQFSRIGQYAMVGGFSRITHDVPPYTIGAGSPYKLGGLNLVGLKRHGFSLDVRRSLARAFKLVYRNNLRMSEALEQIAATVEMNPHIEHWLEFCRHSKRGLIGFQGVSPQQAPDEECDELEELLEEKV